MPDKDELALYDAVSNLEQAGLTSKVGDDDGTAVYTVEEFELALTVRETEVSITPELIEGIAQKNESPAIERVLADYGIITFAFAYDLVMAHSKGRHDPADREPHRPVAWTRV
ncbi:hypothetical protein [Halogeometricum luteum]|nr:hypothetical protein [Halogeometricum sp. S3BR5-2]